MKKKHAALILFGVFVAFSLGYVLGIKGRSGTFSVVGAQGTGPSETRRGGEVEASPAKNPGDTPPESLPSDASADDAETTAPPVTGDVRVHVNTATVEELIDLPGIGPVLARRIVDYRNENGPFADGEDLMKVKGIGNAIWGDLEEFVAFD